MSQPQILIDPTELREHSRAIRAQATQTAGDVNAMRTRLDGLSAAFRGEAASAFDARWSEWQVHANGLLEALDSLGEFLTNAATTIEDIDRQLGTNIR